MKHRVERARDAVRLHCCEQCGKVFVCEECSEAMSAVWRDDCVLYTRTHAPKNILTGQARVNFWLCERCKGT